MTNKKSNLKFSVPLERTEITKPEGTKRVPKKKYRKFDFGDDPRIWWDDWWGSPFQTG